MEKPFAPSCERNSKPILEVLMKQIVPDDKLLFEVASGTGQHAVYLAPKFPHLLWQTSDLLENHQGICQWLEDSETLNVRKPILYQAGTTAWPDLDIDLVFTANSLHIMSWDNCLSLFEDLSKLRSGAKVLFYGPFNYNNQFTSESNAQFHQSLMEKNPQSGIRDFEKVNQQMTLHGFQLLIDIEMPANNRVLVFKKQS